MWLGPYTLLQKGLHFSISFVYNFCKLALVASFKVYDYDVDDDDDDDYYYSLQCY